MCSHSIRPMFGGYNNIVLFCFCFRVLVDYCPPRSGHVNECNRCNECVGRVRGRRRKTVSEYISLFRNTKFWIKISPFSGKTVFVVRETTAFKSALGLKKICHSRLRTGAINSAVDRLRPCSKFYLRRTYVSKRINTKCAILLLNNHSAACHVIWH